MADLNRTPEQQARAAIDTKLEQAGWRVQSMGKTDFGAGVGIAVREYPTDVGPADYVLFIDRRAVGVIEAKRDEWGHRITDVENQSGAYAAATLKWVNNSRAAALRVREHRRGDALYESPRSGAALAGGVQLPAAGDDAGVGRAA